MVTHDATAAAYADRVVLLADGRLAGDLREPDDRTRSSTRCARLAGEPC
jgi:putative ABC transport system ATP-binding protein